MVHRHSRCPFGDARHVPRYVRYVRSYIASIHVPRPVGLCTYRYVHRDVLSVCRWPGASSELGTRARIRAFASVGRRASGQLLRVHAWMVCVYSISTV